MKTDATTVGFKAEREGKGTSSLFAESARAAFASFVTDAAFPCLGAKAALNAASYMLLTYEELASPDIVHSLHADLVAFTKSDIARTSEYASFIAVFRNPRAIAERTFERLLWSQLQKLHELDRMKAPWDPNVSSDPDNPRFSFSIGGHACYVIGLHRDSSRLARRFPWPAMVFNPHAQFEKLRSDGKWKRMQETIRARDVALQGSVNPMLSDFGKASEARQYSGRQVEKEWHPEFRAGGGTSGGCPFAH
jgi:FPC/CPF motif-containing protein YcgG